VLTDHPEDIVCMEKEKHKRPCCKHCVKGYTIVKEYGRKCYQKAGKTFDILGKQQQVEETLHQIDICGQYLNEYRSHLAPLKTESEYDAAKLESLPDDTAKVISDWKMKILACYFRENQGKFFGKRGISLLGFMIVTNLKEEEERQKGTKNV
jgi:hypothetical protein